MKETDTENNWGQNNWGHILYCYIAAVQDRPWLSTAH
jgi:hypothetical protein